MYFFVWCDNFLLSVPARLYVVMADDRVENGENVDDISDSRILDVSEEQSTEDQVNNLRNYTLNLGLNAD